MAARDQGIGNCFLRAWRMLPDSENDARRLSLLNY
jgi:hypothetical protein